MTYAVGDVLQTETVPCRVIENPLLTLTPFSSIAIKIRSFPTGVALNVPAPASVTSDVPSFGRSSAKCGQTMRLRHNPPSHARSTSHAASWQKGSNFRPPKASRVCGWREASALRPLNYSRRFAPGWVKALTATPLGKRGRYRVIWPRGKFVPRRHHPAGAERRIMWLPYLDLGNHQIRDEFLALRLRP